MIFRFLWLPEAIFPPSIALSDALPSVSYTHLDVYKRQRQESGKNVVADEEHDADERHETDRSFHLLACQNEQTRGEQFEGVKQIAIQQFSCVGQKRFPIHAL